MKDCLHFILCLFLTSLIVLGEASDSLVYDLVKAKIQGQVGDPYLWPQAGNGGYILKFSADIDNDGNEEDFLGGTMGASGLHCDWSVYSGNRFLGNVQASLGGFTVIEDERGLYIPWWRYKRVGVVIAEQRLSDRFAIENEREINEPDFDRLRELWNSMGRQIEPKVDAILLVDYARGDRNWREFSMDNSVRTRSGQPILAEDEDRLSTISIGPEEALDWLNRSKANDERRPKSRRPTGDVSGVGKTSQNKVAIESGNSENKSDSRRNLLISFAIGLLFVVLIVWRLRGLRSA